MYEWKTCVDEMGREYPVCTPVLTADKDKVFTDADVEALEAALQRERVAGRPEFVDY